MKNNKGFTLIEILAVVTILGIISMMAIVAYTKYLSQSRNQAHKVMAKSASTAAEQFVMDNPGVALETVEKVVNGETIYEIKNVNSQPGISFDDLVAEGYLDGIEDPYSRGSSCAGTVRIGLVNEKNAFGEHKDGVLDLYIFVVDECCSNNKARYTYTYKEGADGKETVETVDKNSVICP